MEDDMKVAMIELIHKINNELTYVKGNAQLFMIEFPNRPELRNCVDCIQRIEEKIRLFYEKYPNQEFPRR